MKYILFIILLFPHISFAIQTKVMEMDIRTKETIIRTIEVPPPSADSIKPYKLSQAKQEALRRIIILIPGADTSNYIIKETNLLSRVAELTRKECRFTISPSELTELDWYDAIWQEIKAIRLASDSIETEINALTTYDAVNNYNIETNILWP